MSQSSILLVVCIGFCVPYAMVLYHVVLGLRLKRQVDNDYEALRAIARERCREAELLLTSLHQEHAST
jgi:hypothetical protein